ncbi:MAG: SDR family NAD(P)-dependent oxidoreductase, partial [Polyangiales bacterium]
LVGRDLDTLRAVLGDAPGHALIVCDLEHVEQSEACVQRAAAALSGLDAFVSCAGIAEHAAITTITSESLERQLRVNFTTPFMIAQRAAEHIAAAGGGAMLFVASTLGLAQAETTAAYAASKAALISATRSLALELGPRAIRVNAVAPGVVDTGMVRALRLRPGQSAPTGADLEVAVRAQLEALRKLHPLGRLGRPEDVAETAMYLLRAPFVTGAVVNVDGGLLLGGGGA